MSQYAPARPQETPDQAPEPTARRPRLPGLGTQILLALALGVAAGALARTADLPWLTATLSTVGGLFVQLLKLAVPPLVFTAIVASIASLAQVADAARLAIRTLVWFAISGLIAVGIGIGIGMLTNPGAGVTLDTGAAKPPEKAGSWTGFLTGIIPTNPVAAFVEGNVLQIVVLGAVVGFAALKVGEAARPLLDLNDAVLQVTNKALWWVIRLAPIGTFALIGKAAATYGWDLLGPLATFTVDVYVGCALVLFVVYPLLLRFAARLPVAPFFRGAWPAIQLAFVSRSSVGTMPLTQQVTVDRLGVPRDYASFAIPLGATSKMDGCAAVYPALAAIFVAQVFGMPLGVREYVLIALVSVLGSAATAGLTGAVVMLTLTLSTLGLPLAGVGLLLAIDPILDMMRTATNVAGQAALTTVVAARAGILDRQAYASA